MFKSFSDMIRTDGLLMLFRGLTPIVAGQLAANIFVKIADFGKQMSLSKKKVKSEPTMTQRITWMLPAFLGFAISHPCTVIGMQVIYAPRYDKLSF